MNQHIKLSEIADRQCWIKQVVVNYAKALFFQRLRSAGLQRM